MRGLSSTISGLRRSRTLMDQVLRTARTSQAAGHPDRQPRTPLTRVTGFGSNPGNLGMLTYVPERLPSSPALIVVLHGCTQTPAGYNDGAGWSDLADSHGFVLVFPEQVQANNPKACFNWFLPGDTTRDEGEALSIRQMIDRAVSDHGVDTSRIFITGLSAGGAMANVMLGTYPELFAAGAIIAGLPYGAAGNVQDALAAMFQGRSLPAREWGDRVRSASPHRGKFPRISIWHGQADTVVKPGNGAELAKQWTDVHGLGAAPGERTVVDGHLREVWRGSDGVELVEAFAIAGMGHGTPLAVGVGDMEGGVAGAFMLDVGISSSHHILRFFGLEQRSSDGRASRAPLKAESPTPSPKSDRTAPLHGEILPPGGQRKAENTGAGADPFGLPGSLSPEVRHVIEKAFQAAGLMKP